MIDRGRILASLTDASGRNVSRETFDRLSHYVALLREESTRQNLVSAASLFDVWDRHILDSAQLARWGPTDSDWIDLGSGAGLPGIVIACLVDGPVTLAEPRGLRADFLHRVVETLRLDATVSRSRAETLSGQYAAITARAVAPLTKLLEISHHLSTGNTVWILPKGRTAVAELAEARKTWQGVFHVEQSVTDPDAQIIVAREVKATQS